MPDEGKASWAPQEGLLEGAGHAGSEGRSGRYSPVNIQVREPAPKVAVWGWGLVFPFLSVLWSLRVMGSNGDPQIPQVWGDRIDAVE